ncbi:class I SAM-dependent methyltransferase [Neorhizobium sp. NCHU2750]|uniref:class I SAM-dependent methyltransferase n=1 Tax=Neorhizobium sp. NCHU2750 TaxID=1825976 RepID=UPI000E71C106|nr:hypothetical protein NCHU2750_53280 [Neorhizobium sp. NCHU2750]
MTGFQSRWLDLREPVDNSARHAGLRRLAVDFVAENGPEARIVDLGCGTGSTFRALSPEASGWRWQLVDNDPRLLDEARSRHGANDHLEFVSLDLTNISNDLFAGTTLVTASALFDLVSLELVETLAFCLKAQRASLYAALNYNGSCTWSQQHEADGVVVAAFNDHQRNDKGMGPALGRDSGPALKQVFEKAGFRVLVGESSWRFGPEHGELHRQFIEGMAHAAGEMRSLDPLLLDDWRQHRLARTNSSSCEVGHWDVLAFASSMATTG